MAGGGGVDHINPPFFVAFTALAGWMAMFIVGHIRDFFRKLVKPAPKGYAPIRQDYEDFYTRRLYYRIHDCWNRPIASAPGAWIDVLERTLPDGQRPLRFTNTTKRCLNLGSYNYLGFAAADEYCTPRVLQTMEQAGWSMCSSRTDAGTTPVHVDLERLVAKFVGKEDAVTFGMGFATNSIVIPALVGKGCLLLSDSLNHASIIAGARGAGCKVKVFAHNNMLHLEQLLRDSVAYGQPKTRRPWKKILIVVEGIYSMEGQLSSLPDIIALKKRYKAYLYLDEAHSIGAMGATGKGVCEHWGVDPADVDVMMGTFTKSFGSCGGYIAADKPIIRHLRRIGPGHCYATSLSPPAAEQIVSALKLLGGEDGSTRGIGKIKQLHDNANYFRHRLRKMGCSVLGDEDSPVMPIMLYNPGKISAVSRLLFERNIAMVVVGFPATPLLSARMRVCISAAHSRADLDWAAEVMEEVSGICLINYDSAGKNIANLLTA